MNTHSAAIEAARTAWRVWQSERLLVQSDAVLEVTERYGERVFATVPCFEPGAVAEALLTPSDAPSTCPLEGTAHYFDAADIPDAAWTCSTPNAAVACIAGYIGFDPSKGLRVERAGQR